MSEEIVLSALGRIRDGCQYDGWDSYDGAAVTDKALKTAEILTKSSWATPRSDGGIQLSWLNEAITIGINEDGSFDDLVFFGKNANEYVEEQG